MVRGAPFIAHLISIEKYYSNKQLFRIQEHQLWQFVKDSNVCVCMTFLRSPENISTPSLGDTMNYEPHALIVRLIKHVMIYMKTYQYLSWVIP